MANVGEEQLLRKAESAGTSALGPESAARDGERDARLSWRDLVKQILVAFVIHSVTVQVGINLSFSAVLLPQLAAEAGDAGSRMHVDRDAASWIASLLALALPSGALIVGSLMDRFGRKRVAMLSTLPFVACWLMHWWAADVRVIYAARLLAGFGSGLTTVCLIYVAELAHPSQRATLLSINSVLVCLGILMTCVLGTVLHWRTVALCYALLSASSCLALLLLPESPHWLHAFANEPARATRVLSWLYADERAFAAEARRLWDHPIQRRRETLRDLLCYLAQPVAYKPLLLLFVLFLLQQLTGCYVIIFYAVDVFRRVGGGGGMDEYRALITLGAIRFVAAIVSTATAIRLGRKAHLVASTAGMLVSALLAVPAHGYASSLCVLSYVAFGSIGVLVIPWALIGELLPLKVRGKFGGLLVATSYLLMFGLVKSFPYLIASVEMRTIFYGVAAVNAIFVYVVLAKLPETHGKSFREIEEHYSS